jgi:hypothetical protein
LHLLREASDYSKKLLVDHSLFCCHF